VETIVSTGNWAHERRFVMPRLLPRRVFSLRTLVLLLVTAAVGWLGWTWYRASSFVKVEHVTVTGVSGPEVVQIRRALTTTALGMTTLHMDISKLKQAVSEYSYVQTLTVTRHGAHVVGIAVTEQIPVATVEIGGSSEVVDGNDQLLPDTTISHGALPTIPISLAPAGRVITAKGARGAIAVLAAAPYSLLAHVSSATSSSAHGVIVQLRNGPQVYFGPTQDLHAKWAAMTAVLQDQGSAGAAYIDVSDPRRPAAGVDVKPAQAEALGLVSATTATSSQSDSPAP
jgi:cell division septal protein FtsQ